MKSLANTGSFDHAHFNIVGSSYKNHTIQKLVPDIVHPPFLFKCAPMPE